MSIQQQVKALEARQKGRDSVTIVYKATQGSEDGTNNKTRVASLGTALEEAAAGKVKAIEFPLTAAEQAEERKLGFAALDAAFEAMDRDGKETNHV